MKKPKKYKPLLIYLGKGKPRKGFYTHAGFYLFSGDYISQNKYNISWEYDKEKGIRLIPNAPLHWSELSVIKNNKSYFILCGKKHKKALKKLAFFFTEGGESTVRMNDLKKYCGKNKLALFFPESGIPFFQIK